MFVLKEGQFTGHEYSDISDVKKSKIMTNSDHRVMNQGKNGLFKINNFLHFPTTGKLYGEKTYGN